MTAAVVPTAMNRHLKIGCRVTLVVLGTIIFCAGSRAQTVITDNTPVLNIEDEQSEPKQSPSLELKLTTTSTVLCMDSPLRLELEIVNIGEEILSLQNSRIWKQFSYSCENCEGGPWVGGLGIGSDIQNGEQVHLTTGMVYRGSYELKLPIDFFMKPGTYSLRTIIDSINSNDIKFDIYNCGIPQKVEDK